MLSLLLEVIETPPPNPAAPSIGLFNTSTLWAEFIAAILGLIVVVLWRVVNKYLPPDADDRQMAAAIAEAQEREKELKDALAEVKRQSDLATLARLKEEQDEEGRGT